ncbi:MAG: hypothetical protein JRN20_10195 [Nitrososphaerota archaeon]|nr:hypothetical protein [Nitrososphaerota archaeon]MDG6923571.1 hypothetical protein [Nitrososphaerota archaeon]
MSDTSDDGVSRKHLSSRCDIKGRVYTIDLLIFVNGCFANISEDQSGKMGAISVSIKTGERATSTSLIPESKGNIFARMVGELLADKLRGIAIISLYLREELDAESMKTLINEMRKLLNKD